MLAMLAVCSALVCASIQNGETRDRSASQRVSDSARAGAYAVETVERYDIAREGRDALRCTIRYPRIAPEHDARVPLIVFSHGMGGSSDAFAELSELWASHGYVVIHPTHADSLKLRRDGGEDLRERLGEFARNPRAYTRNVDPVGRVHEVRLILDRLDDVEAAIEGLRDASGKGRIDRDRIAVAGHSAGAMTAQLCSGVRARLRDRDANERMRDALSLRDFGDQRIKAGVIISGQGTTSRMFTEDSWKHVRVPLFVVCGSRDTSPASDETPQSRRHPFEKSRGREGGGGAAYLMYIDGATHSSYQGKSTLGTARAMRLLGENLSDDELKTIGELTAAGTLLFLDAHIKGDEHAKQTLGGPDQTINPFDALAPGKVEYRVK